MQLMVQSGGGRCGCGMSHGASASVLAPYSVARQGNGAATVVFVGLKGCVAKAGCSRQRLSRLTAAFVCLNAFTAVVLSLGAFVFVVILERSSRRPTSRKLCLQVLERLCATRRTPATPPPPYILDTQFTATTHKTSSRVEGAVCRIPVVLG